MATPLTIDNFEFEKLRAKSPQAKKGGNVTYYSVPFEHEGGKSLLKIEGNFRVFRHETRELAILRQLKSMIRMTNSLPNWEKGWLNFSYYQRSKIPKSFKTSNLELVKTTANGKYKNVYARIYFNKSGKVNCNLSEHKEVNDV